MGSSSLLLLLAATACFCQAAYRQSSQDARALPMDYFDDVYNRDFKISPDSTFTFNFEQTRRDQPPHVEMREENVGRYFYNKPPTTTPASIFSMNTGAHTQHVYPKMGTESPFNHHQPHQYAQRVSTVPPPPKFSFSKSQNQQHPEMYASPLWNVPAASQDIYRDQPVGNVYHNVPSATAPPRPAPRTPLQKTLGNPPQLPSYSEQKQEISFSPSASYVSDSIKNSKSQFPQRAPKLGPVRGHHKFSWDDVKNEREQVSAPPANQPASSPQPPQSHQPSTPHPSPSNKQPPPVPTLSPWYDNFGK